MSTTSPSGLPRQPFGLWASLAWGILAVGAWLGAQLFVGNLLIEWFDGVPGENIAWLATHAPFVSLVTIVTAVVPLAIVALAVRAARSGTAEYLGLYEPARGYTLFGIVALAVLIPLVDAISWFSGRAVTPQFVLDLYSSARDSGTLILLVLALVVAAPVVEETVFRGFLLPGFAASPLGPWGAILLTSAFWALLHAQYQPFYLAQIVVLGALLGWLRLRSGSTILTIGLHGVVNLVSLAQAALVQEWLR